MVCSEGTTSGRLSRPSFPETYLADFTLGDLLGCIHCYLVLQDCLVAAAGYELLEFFEGNGMQRMTHSLSVIQPEHTLAARLWLGSTAEIGALTYSPGLPILDLPQYPKDTQAETQSTKAFLVIPHTG
jgi:hypothetical protein